MKNRILSLLVLILGLNSTVQAQYRGRGGNVSLGLKAGVSLTNFVGADTGGSYSLGFGGGRAGTATIYGFHAGVFANIGLTKLVAFQPELLYSQKGAKVDGSSGALTWRLHYLDVPLTFHVNTNGFFLEAGPQIGFLVASQFKDGGLSIGNKYIYKYIDFGYLAGLGYQLKQGVGVGLRYNGGLVNIPKSVSQSNNATYQERKRNSALQLYVTYSFN